MSNNLPSAYQEVEYIQNTGAEYIILDFTPSSKTHIEMTATPFDIQAANTGKGFIAYGSATDLTTNAFECYSYTGGTLEYHYNGTYKTGLASIAVGTKVHFSQNGNVCITSDSNGNVLSTYTFTAKTFTCPKKLTLFALNRSAGIIPGGASNLYDCQIYENGTLTLNLVPCYRKSDYTPGVYDTVNDVFYTNAGSGTFTISPTDIPYKLPSSYQEVEYIQSSGTQYINTGVTCAYAGDILLSISGDFSSSNNSTSWQGVNAYLQHSFSSSNISNGNSTLAITSDDTIEISYVGYKEKITVASSGNSISRSWSGNSNYGGPIFLFAMSSGTSLFDGTKVYGTLKRAQIYSSGKLVRNFIPSYVKATKVAGLYDTINDVFYPNAGSGLFAIGALVKVPRDPLVFYNSYLPDMYAMWRRAKIMKSSQIEDLATLLLLHGDTLADSSI